MAKAPIKRDTEADMGYVETRNGQIDSSHPGIAPDVGPDDPRKFTDSGIEIEVVYDEDDVADIDLRERLGAPGEYPFTRGIHPEMYRSRRWTMRQYAGYATAQESNRRYRYLLEHGSTGLSMAFDQIPLDQVSTSMTINAPAAILLLLYELVAAEQGVPAEQLRGTVQNDILKEYAARGNFIYPPEGAMRLTTDIFAYCHEHIPKWNTISISGYHMREKGCSAVQEVAFTLSNAIAYVQAAIDAGLKVDDFATQIAFFFNGHNNVFQEVAKFRAVRGMWAEIMRDRFSAENPRAQMVRFHTQTGGSTLTAQQPENNIIRVALQGFAAVCGGTQSLHTNGFDEALGLPTEHSARIALRTQQVIAHESGAADTVDPFAGSYYVERLTADIESDARALMDKVEELGGSVHAIEAGFVQREIEESAFAYHRRLLTKQDILVGVNEYTEGGGEVEVEILRIDPETERDQVERLRHFREDRDHELVQRRLEDLRQVARGEGNLLYPLKDALRDRATLGEVCGVMRDEFGEYKPPV